MSRTLAIVWLVFVSHMVILGITKYETRDVQRNIATFIESVHSH